MIILETKQYKKWFAKLKDLRAKYLISAKLLRIYSHGALFGDHKSVGDDVFELRIDTGPGYRIYLTIKGNSLLLLLIGGDKSTQQADIKKARRMAKSWRSNGEVKN